MVVAWPVGKVDETASVGGDPHLLRAIPRRGRLHLGHDSEEDGLRRGINGTGISGGTGGTATRAQAKRSECEWGRASVTRGHSVTERSAGQCRAVQCSAGAPIASAPPTAAEWSAPLLTGLPH